VQDSWKATRNLTVEFGVRWSYWPPWHSRWGNISMFNPDFFDPSKAAVVDRAGGFIVSGDRYNGIVLPGNGVPSAEGAGSLSFTAENSTGNTGTQRIIAVRDRVACGGHLAMWAEGSLYPSAVQNAATLEYA